MPLNGPREAIGTRYHPSPRSGAEVSSLKWHDSPDPEPAQSSPSTDSRRSFVNATCGGSLLHCDSPEGFTGLDTTSTHDSSLALSLGVPHAAMLQFSMLRTPSHCRIYCLSLGSAAYKRLIWSSWVMPSRMLAHGKQSAPSPSCKWSTKYWYNCTSR